MKTLQSLGRSLLFIVSGFLLLTVFPLGVWLLFNFKATAGLLFALLGIGAPLLGLNLTRYLGRRENIYLRLSQLFGAAVTFLVIVILVGAPDGRPTPESPIRHMYSATGRFYRLSPLNLIPETEQMNVGINLVGPADPFIDRAKADRLSDLTLGIYAEMEQDPDFAALGSVMGYPLRDAFGLPYDNGHYFLYVPDSLATNEPTPAIVFLHGAGGPFKAYQWVWRQFAEKYGYVIISPTFGFGNWWEAGGTEAVIRALEHASTEVAIDSDRVWLAGLSNGGYGTIYTGLEHGDRFQGLILLSPGLPSPDLYQEDAPFYEVWRERPILLLTGEADLRMPMPYIEQHIGFFEAGGVDLEARIYPAEDHFLFFSQPDLLFEAIHLWIEAEG